MEQFFIIKFKESLNGDKEWVKTKGRKAMWCLKEQCRICALKSTSFTTEISTI